MMDTYLQSSVNHLNKTNNDFQNISKSRLNLQKLNRVKSKEMHIRHLKTRDHPHLNDISLDFVATGRK